MKTHPRTACPECDDVSNECCDLCEGTDDYCPICKCPAIHCEFGEDGEDAFHDDFDEMED